MSLPPQSLCRPVSADSANAQGQGQAENQGVLFILTNRINTLLTLLIVTIIYKYDNDNLIIYGFKNILWLIFVIIYNDNWTI